MAFAARTRRIYGDSHRPVGHVGMARQFVRCTLVLLVSACLSLSLPLLVCDTVLAQSQPLVTVEIRYHVHGASEVYLVWGVNGWNVVLEAERPEGTVLRNGVMHTLMSRQGDTFGATLQAPQGTIIDYGFAITRTERGAVVQIWQGKDGGDYHLSVVSNGVIDVEASPSIATQVASGHLGIDLPWLGLVLAIGALAGLAVLVVRIRSLKPLPRIGDSVIDVRRTLPGQAQHGMLYGVRDSQPGRPSSDAAPSEGSSERVSTSGATFFRGRRLAYLRDLLRELVSRELKLRYRRSILGMLWSLLNPLAQLLVFVLIFGRVLRLNIPNYPSFVFVGVLSWNWFQSALSIATGAITDNRELVKRPGFPMAILPVVTVTTHLIHFVLALPILLLFVLLNGGRLTGTVLFLPLVMALQFLLILGLGYLTAAIHVTFRDTQYLLGVFLMLLFYLTPVFYDSKTIPERYQAIYNLNPMARLVTAYRTILVQGQVPDLVGLLILGVVLGLLVWLGYAVFRRASYRFVEEL